MFRSEVEVVRSGPGLGDGDGLREEGVANLAAGLAYKRGRLCDMTLNNRGMTSRMEDTHASRFASTLTDRLPSSSML